MTLCLAVPRGLTDCRLRFVSWSGDVVSSGAIKSAEITAVAAVSPPDDILTGDVDGNGEISIADVTELIDYLLLGEVIDVQVMACDVDNDGKVSIADVTSLIDYIINRKS